MNVNVLTLPLCTVCMCVYMWVRVCMCVCMCVRVCMCVYITCGYVYVLNKQ